MKNKILNEEFYIDLYKKLKDELYDCEGAQENSEKSWHKEVFDKQDKSASELFIARRALQIFFSNNYEFIKVNSDEERPFKKAFSDKNYTLNCKKNMEEIFLYVIQELTESVEDAAYRLMLEKDKERKKMYMEEYKYFALDNLFKILQKCLKGSKKHYKNFFKVMKQKYKENAAEAEKIYHIRRFVTCLSAIDDADYKRIFELTANLKIIA